MNNEQIDALRHNYIAYFRLFGGQHRIHFHADDTSAWIVANGPPGNHILRAQFGPGAQAERQIDQLLAAVHRRTAGIRWLLFPQDEPADLGERLLARGLAAEEGDFWLFHRLDDLPDGPQPPDFSVAPVADLPSLRAWWTASAQGFGTNQKAAQVWYDAYRRHYQRRGFGTGAHAVQVVGRLGREIVTSATLLLAAGIAGIYDVSTRPEFRGRGYGSALTGWLLAEARRRGYAWAGLQTSDAVEFYQRLGFAVGFREQEFFWSAAE